MSQYGNLLHMLPVLFSVGDVAVSSFGVFLALGFLLGIFLVWRLARAWDLNEEKVLDLILVTFTGGLIGARIYFAIENWHLFSNSLFSLVLINKIPGFSFWGGFLGGWLTLYFFAKHKRADFWQLADIALVGLLGGLILSNIGCFLGSCNIGAPTKIFVAVTQVGNVGKRWPVQLFESFLLTVILLKTWSQATHFHQRGKIVGLGLTLIGIIQLMLEPLRQSHAGALFSFFLIVLGVTIIYRVTKQNPISQFRSLVIFLIKFFSDPQARIKGVQNLNKSWYNFKANFSWKLRNFKKLLRRFNVKLS